jgi:hypothetical protein
MYLDAIKSFPKTDTKLHTEKGDAFHIKTDVFKRIIWYAYPGEMGTIALSPERVAEIKKLNKDGVKPKDLLEFTKVEKVVEIGYQNVVGQDSVNRFEKSFVKKKRPNKKRPSNNANPAATAQGVKPASNPNQAPKAANPNQAPKGGNPANAGQKKANHPPRGNGQKGPNKNTNPQGDKNANS